MGFPRSHCNNTFESRAGKISPTHRDPYYHLTGLEGSVATLIKEDLESMPWQVKAQEANLTILEAFFCVVVVYSLLQQSLHSVSGRNNMQEHKYVFHCVCIQQSEQ